MTQRFSKLEEALEALVAGRLVIVVDSEDREDEGDFVAAAETVTPEMVHFMISHGRGLLCVPVLPEMAQRLELTPMVANRDPGAPCFTVPVDHVVCKTGISPWERTQTIRAMLDPHSRPEDFIRPGHIFPLVARPGGVLERPGHTEASIDLARLAGLTPAGMLCEICSRDGLNMADRSELLEISQQHRIPIITIDALIEARQQGVTPETVRRGNSSSSVDFATAQPR